MAGEVILVVDDHPINLKLIKVLLELEGYRIYTATNAQEVFKLLEENIHPQLILMDIQLPDIDGLELTARLKADPRYKQIIIIAITAYAMKGDKEKALAAGCDGYVPKPIDTQAMPKLIREYLDKQPT